MKLRSKCLVVRDNERRLLHRFDDFCHSKCLAGAGNTHKGLRLLSRKYAVCDLPYRLRLIASRSVFTYYFKLSHGAHYVWFKKKYQPLFRG